MLRPPTGGIAKASGIVKNPMKAMVQRAMYSLQTREHGRGVEQTGTRYDGPLAGMVTEGSLELDWSLDWSLV